VYRTGCERCNRACHSEGNCACDSPSARPRQSKGRRADRDRIHCLIERRGNDLHTTATVSIFTAVLGGEAEVETLSGKIKLNVPAGTQPEQVFRLAGRGMPSVKNANEKGDLYVRLKVQIPKYLSPKQRELLEEASRIKF